MLRVKCARSYAHLKAFHRPAPRCLPIQSSFCLTQFTGSFWSSAAVSASIRSFHASSQQLAGLQGLQHSSSNARAHPAFTRPSGYGYRPPTYTPILSPTSPQYINSILNDNHKSFSFSPSALPRLLSRELTTLASQMRRVSPQVWARVVSTAGRGRGGTQGQTRSFSTGGSFGGNSPDWNKVPKMEWLKLILLSLGVVATVAYLVYIGSGMILFVLAVLVLLKSVNALFRILSRYSDTRGPSDLSAFKKGAEQTFKKSQSDFGDFSGRTQQQARKQARQAQQQGSEWSQTTWKQMNQSMNNPNNPFGNANNPFGGFTGTGKQAKRKGGKQEEMEGWVGVAQKLVPGLVSQLIKSKAVDPKMRMGLKLGLGMLQHVFKFVGNKQKLMQECHRQATDYVYISPTVAELLGGGKALECSAAHQTQSVNVNGQEQITLAFNVTGRRAQGVITVYFNSDSTEEHGFKMTSMLLESKGRHVDVLHEDSSHSGGPTGGGSGRGPEVVDADYEVRK